MINTAILIHKGVLNLSSLQLQDNHMNSLEFGNKVAVLSGDFILASVSTSLAELNNTYVGIGDSDSVFCNLSMLLYHLYGFIC